MPNFSFGFLQMPLPRNCARNLASIGSCSVLDKSATRIFKRIQFTPCSTGYNQWNLLKRQCSIKANLAFTSSIQSKIKSGSPCQNFFDIFWRQIIINQIYFNSGINRTAALVPSLQFFHMPSVAVMAGN